MLKTIYIAICDNCGLEVEITPIDIALLDGPKGWFIWALKSPGQVGFCTETCVQEFKQRRKESQITPG